MSDQQFQEFVEMTIKEKSSLSSPPLQVVDSIGMDRSDQPKRSSRHGARNQNRHKNFTKWLIQAFPHLLEAAKYDGTRPEKRHILDVAGGKGELAARLSMCHQCSVVLVDPRKANVIDCFQRVVLPKLPKKHQQRLQQKLELNPGFLESVIDSRVNQLVCTFDEDAMASNRDLQEAIRNASLLVGMHADGATEAIVDCALQYSKPFVVVPCCVFPRLFSQRTLIQPDGSQVPVRTHEQFCQYLLLKDSRLTLTVLPFEGRNIAIWWDGKDSESS